MRKINEKRIPTTQDAGRGKMQNKKNLFLNNNRTSADDTFVSSLRNFGKTQPIKIK